MQLTDPRDLWINIVGSVPAMGPGDAQDPTGHVTPPAAAPRQRRQSDAVLDGEKTGAALLLCGVLLALVGVTFTAMGWRHYQANDNSEWTRLLGPILISVGGTFILTSVCKFWVQSCWPCGAPGDDVLVIPAARDGGAPGRPPFVLRGINQPVVVQGAAAMLCIPPPYGFVAPELHQAGAGSSGLPSYDAVFRMDDATADEGSSARGAETDHQEHSSQKEEQERRRRSDSAVSQPPAYEDIYPSPPKQNSP